jgi:hypothetical protein
MRSAQDGNSVRSLGCSRLSLGRKAEKLGRSLLTTSSNMVIAHRSEQRSDIRITWERTQSLW